MKQLEVSLRNLGENAVRLSQGGSPHSLCGNAQINDSKGNFKGGGHSSIRRRWRGMLIMLCQSNIWKISLWDQCWRGLDLKYTHLQGSAQAVTISLSVLDVLCQWQVGQPAG